LLIVVALLLSLIVLLHIHLVILLLVLMLLLLLMRAILLLVHVVASLIALIAVNILLLLLHVCTVTMMSRHRQKLIVVLVCQVESDQLGRSVRARLRIAATCTTSVPLLRLRAVGFEKLSKVLPKIFPDKVHKEGVVLS
jgi:hypothetical protein